MTKNIILTAILGGVSLTIYANTVSYYFTEAGADGNNLTSATTFANELFSYYYEDNTPTGNGTYGYIFGEGLAFENASTLQSESQTSLFFDSSSTPRYSTDVDFTFTATLEIPAIYSGFSLDEVLTIGASLFYGPDNSNRYQDELEAFIAVANVGPDANGRFLAYGDSVDDGPPANLLPTSALGVKVVWSYTASDRTLRLTVAEITPSIGSYVEGTLYTDYTKTFPNYTEFVPSVTFNAENLRVVPQGQSNLSANKPIVTSVVITGGSGGSGNNGGGNNFLYADEDNDGVPDILENKYGGNSYDPNDAATTVDYLVNQNLYSEQQILQTRLNSVRISDNFDGTFTLYVDVEERSDFNTGDWNYNSSQQFTITPSSVDKAFLQLVLPE